MRRFLRKSGKSVQKNLGDSAAPLYSDFTVNFKIAKHEKFLFDFLGGYAVRALH